MVLYRKYRPQKFSELIGQEAIAQTLLGQLEAGKVGHAYLFCGPKGTGKTSTARILAKAVNCAVYGSRSTVHGKSVNRERITVNKLGEPCNKCDSCTSVIDGSHLDLIEMDAASNRNIDDVRDIREKIKLAPVSGRFKVYIIDEVHMLTKEAFNALLKTLEEPPAHAIFVLCTTEVSKLPATILSRVQRFNFTRASDADIEKAVLAVAKKEGITIGRGAALAITRASDGSFRDAISILDQLGSGKNKIEEADIAAVATSSNWNQIFGFCENIISGKFKTAILTLEGLWQAKADVAYFGNMAVLFFEKLLLAKMGMNASELEVEDGQYREMETLCEMVTQKDLQNLIKLFMVAEAEMKNYPLAHIPFILAVSKYSLEKFGENLPEVVSEVPRRVNEEIKVSKKVAASKDDFKVDANWGDFVSKVRAANSHVAAILRSTKPVSLVDDILTLGVYFRFHKEKLEEVKISRMLEDVFSQMTDTPVRFRFVLEKREKKSPAAVRDSDLVEAGGSELEIMAQEIFSK